MLRTLLVAYTSCVASLPIALLTEPLMAFLLKFGLLRSGDFIHRHVIDVGRSNTPPVFGGIDRCVAWRMGWPRVRGVLLRRIKGREATEIGATRKLNFRLPHRTGPRRHGWRWGLS